MKGIGESQYIPGADAVRGPGATPRSRTARVATLRATRAGSPGKPPESGTRAEFDPRGRGTRALRCSTGPGLYFWYASRIASPRAGRAREKGVAECRGAPRVEGEAGAWGWESRARRGLSRAVNRHDSALRTCRGRERRIARNASPAARVEGSPAGWPVGRACQPTRRDSGLLTPGRGAAGTDGGWP